MREGESDIRDELSAYLDGELTPQERSRVEAYLEQDTAAREQLVLLKAQSAALKSMPRLKAPAALATAVMQEIATLPNESKHEASKPKASSNWQRWPLSTAALLMLSIVGFIALQSRTPQPSNFKIHTEDEFKNEKQSTLAGLKAAMVEEHTAKEAAMGAAMDPFDHAPEPAPALPPSAVTLELERSEFSGKALSDRSFTQSNRPAQVDAGGLKREAQKPSNALAEDAVPSGNRLAPTFKDKNAQAANAGPLTRKEEVEAARRSNVKGGLADLGLSAASKDATVVKKSDTVIAPDAPTSEPPRPISHASHSGNAEPIVARDANARKPSGESASKPAAVLAQSEETMPNQVPFAYESAKTDETFQITVKDLASFEISLSEILTAHRGELVTSERPSHDRALKSSPTERSRIESYEKESGKAKAQREFELLVPKETRAAFLLKLSEIASFKSDQGRSDSASITGANKAITRENEVQGGAGTASKAMELRAPAPSGRQQDAAKSVLRLIVRE